MRRVIGIALGLSMCFGSAVAAEQGDYLFDALKSPDFAKPYAEVTGAAKLPAWVKQGGTSSPGEPLSVNGRNLPFYSGCKPHDCPSEQILVLHDVTAHRVIGVFVHNEGEMMSPRSTQLTWLGKPSAEERQALLGKVRVD